MKQDIVLSPDLYYQAIIQLRPETPEIMKFISSQARKRDDVKVSRIVRTDKGTDIYITDQRFARALGNKMKKSFKGTLKTTRSLFTQDRQTSKKVYRVTVLFRPELKN